MVRRVYADERAMPPREASIEKRYARSDERMSAAICAAREDAMLLR